ncbi:ATP-binding cassette domain-containing protein [Staphylococcus chromogenes]|uniref:ATP-binding cassette domain-containing protein n=1 Tax=Staphylococcus chromogenes TaxID=46126 RepID=UPI002886693B|nr:ATP-binding cassette domain-containing protein [Staphylococcus chromogenes]MDT0698723.1 ATP-binding cassette domain-containing protein [Staphylococcus chromogenes]
MTEIQLEVEKLSVSTPAQTLLHDIDLALMHRHVTALIGPSGSGKTLLSKALLKQLPHTMTMACDTLRYKGESVTEMKTLLGKRIGYMSQDYMHSFNEHTSLEKQLLQIYRYHYDVTQEEAHARIQQALGWVGLEDLDLKQRYRFMLSGGQLQRLVIASVMMLAPDVIIADEPTASLDVVNGAHIIQLLKHLVDAHDVTLCIITHDLSHVARICDEVYVMNQGKIVASGPFHEFDAHHPHPMVAQLFQQRRRLGGLQ